MKMRENENGNQLEKPHTVLPQKYFDSTLQFNSTTIPCLPFTCSQFLAPVIRRKSRQNTRSESNSLDLTIESRLNIKFAPDLILNLNVIILVQINFNFSNSLTLCICSVVLLCYRFTYFDGSFIPSLLRFYNRHFLPFTCTCTFNLHSVLYVFFLFPQFFTFLTLHRKTRL